MAAVTPVITKHGNNTVTFSWTLTQADAVGHPIPERYSDYADRCVHIIGPTFASATVIWEGSGDGATYAPLTDPQGNAISKTANGIEQVTETPIFQRPSSSGGGGTQSIVVVCTARRGRGGKEV